MATLYGRKEYIKLIADVLVKNYGDTLKESGTDVRMAQAVVSKLKDHLQFHPVDISINEFRKWCKGRRKDVGE